MKMGEIILGFTMVIVLTILISFSIGFLVGTREAVNKLNDVDKAHLELVHKDYKYCPYCGEYLESED